MTWFKVDDHLHSSKKVNAIPRRDRLAAIGLWTIAGAWSSQELTEGFIPDYMIERLGGTARLAQVLCEARGGSASGLWLNTPGGFQFHEWLERNPTREQVQSGREAARERQRRARERSRAMREHAAVTRDNTVTHAPVTRDSRVSHAGSHGPPDPTRPDPTHKSFIEVGVSDDTPPPKAAKKPPQKRRTTIPEDWTLTDHLQAYATTRGVDPTTQLEAFRDYHLSRGTQMLDWAAAWRTWVRKAKEFTRDTPAATVHPLGPWERLPDYTGTGGVA